ncbi:crossover junction endodeoxyribonuclease RuvC [Candidatus Parcubacteria bacterium]|nr:MAG: crossover junction endodeoxyribonuclease RuvC [Candidatus Parcubacteria bacterium]
MIVLGIDPGTTTTGFGVIKRLGTNTTLVKSGVIKISSQLNEPEKLSAQRSALEKIIKECRPEIAAVERIFFFKNKKTAINVAQARGVILEILNSNKIPICEYTPLQVKQAITSYGGASKQQVQKMIKLLLGLSEEPKPDDVADAIAIAICCANSIR